MYKKYNDNIELFFLNYTVDRGRGGVRFDDFESLKLRKISTNLCNLGKKREQVRKLMSGFNVGFNKRVKTSKGVVTGDIGISLLFNVVGRISCSEKINYSHYILKMSTVRRKQTDTKSTTSN